MVAFGVVSRLYLSQSVLSCDDGTKEMRAVGDPIREGAEIFLRVQYTVRFYFLISVHSSTQFIISRTQTSPI